MLTNEIKQNAIPIVGAFSASAGAIEGSISNPGEDVYYKFHFERNTDYYNSNWLEIDFTHFYGDLRLDLYNSLGDHIDYSNRSYDASTSSDGDYEDIRFSSGEPAGDYYLKVSGVGDDVNKYQLKWALPASIPEDRFENNGHPTKATVISGASGSLTGVSIHDKDDVDYYKIQLQRKGTSSDSVNITFTNSCGDLDMYLLDMNGKQLYASKGDANSEIISLAGRPDGDYLLKVNSRMHYNNVNEYTLNWNLPSSVGPEPDKYEGNNSLAAATVLTGKSGAVDATIHSKSDVDVYKIHLDRTGTAKDTVGITFTHEDGDLSLYLYNSAGNLADSSLSDTNAESVSMEGMAAGDYYVKVSGAKSNWYKLNWTLPSSVPPAKDRMEDNDSIARAKAMTGESGSIKNLTHHTKADKDFFKFTLNRTGKESDTISVSGDDNVYLRVFKSNGAGVKGAAQEVNLKGLKAGTYYVRATNDSGQSTLSYNLAWDFRPAPDAYENNNSRGAAKLLSGTSGTIQNLTHHTEKDTDYFKFKLSHKGKSDDKLSVAGDSNVALRVYNSSGKQVKTGKAVNMSGLAAGTYYVQAYNKAGKTTHAYSLSWDLPPAKDAYEKSSGNNIRATATLLKDKTGTLKNLTHHTKTDEDYFKFTITRSGKSSDTISVAGDDNVYLQLYSAAGTALKSKGQSVNLAGLKAGTYYVKAWNKAKQTTEKYNLSWDFNPAPDRFESNNTRGTAAALTGNSGKLANLTLHSKTDTDYFAFDLYEKGNKTDKFSVSGDSNVSLRVFNSSGRQVKSGKSLNLNGLAAGTYYVQAYSPKKVTSDSYTLSWSLNARRADRFENNNSRAKATKLSGTSGAVLDVNLFNKNDTDFYKLQLNHTGNAYDEIAVYYDSSKGAPKLEVFNASGKSVGIKSDYTQNNINVRGIYLYNQPSGTYYAKVSGGGSSVKDYALVWSLTGSSYNNVSANTSWGSTFTNPKAYETAQKLLGVIA